MIHLQKGTSGSYSGFAEDSILLGCPSLGMLDPEEKGTTFLPNVMNYTANDMVSHPQKINLQN